MEGKDEVQHSKHLDPDLASYKAVLWKSTDSEGVTAWSNRPGVSNYGGTFLFKQLRFGQRNALSPRDLSRVILETLAPVAVSRADRVYPGAMDYLREVAATEPGDPLAATVPQPEVRVSVWGAPDGKDIGITVWLKSGPNTENAGTFLVGSQRFAQHNAVEPEEFAQLIVEHVDKTTWKELQVRWDTRYGTEIVAARARGEVKERRPVIRRQVGAHLEFSHFRGNNIPTYAYNTAVESERKTADSLRSAEKRGAMIAMHSVVPAPLMKNSIDHVVVTHGCVFLVNTVTSSKRIAPSLQRRNLKRYAEMSGPFSERLTQRLHLPPETPVPVIPVLSIWSPHDFTPDSNRAIPGAKLAAALSRIARTEGADLPVSIHDMVVAIGSRDTWTLD